MTIFSKAFFMATLAFLAVAGCQPKTESSTEIEGKSDSQVAENQLKVTNFSLHSDLNGNSDREVKIFDYRQNPLHFRAVLNHPVKSAKCKWLFSAKSTSAGNGREIQSLESQISGNEIKAQISLKSNWPVGTYHVSIVIDDTPIFESDFEVTGEVTKIIFLGHSIAPDNGKGLPGEAVQRLGTKDRTIYLQVTTKGIDTTQPEVVWRIYRIKSSKLLELANVLQPKINLQDSVLKAQFRSPKDWEPGTYRATIELNGKPAHQFDFDVR